MLNSNIFFPGRRNKGFTLPAILVVVGALLILAVGVLLITGIERNTSRAFSDRERANLAARAGLEDIKGIFAKESSNDDFLVIQGQEIKASGAAKVPSPYLYIARGSGGGNQLSYRYIPLFSNATLPPSSNAGSTIKAPDAKGLVGTLTKEITIFPWYDPAKVSWIEIPNEKGKIVSRYAYWVEDLQSRVDAGTAGNTKDTDGKHKRYGWKKGDTSSTARFPAPGLNAEESKLGPDGRDTEPPLDQVALYALDPVSGAIDETTLDKTIIDGRKALISPDSVLAVAGVIPPLTRGADGNLADATANSLEKNLTSSVQPYDEQPLVPFAFGMDASVTGKPKLNLNALLAKAPEAAVDEMAAWMKKGLPSFEDRKGGFPEDYLKTLAASAIGYASDGNKPVVKMGTYRGLGASPMISEIVMNIHYLGFITQNKNKFMQYQFVLFGELFNHTNLPIAGNAALSYEVGLPLPNIGAAPVGTRFDDPDVVSTSVRAPVEISLQNDRFWSTKRNVSLQPGEYKFVRFATVNYQINIGSGSVGANFTLTEPLGAAGLSMKWNDIEVERIPSVVRAPFGLTFNASFKKYFGKASIPGHSYGPWGEHINNMGDPRIAHFIRFKGGTPSSLNGVPLGENSFPGNISPNRRNIRQQIYSTGGDPNKLTSYGRVIPSEWPDGGHDAAVSTWSSGWSPARQGNADPSIPPLTDGTGPGFDPTTILGGPLPQAGESITYLSDRKRYYSATELGRIYDPIMFLPTFDPSSGLSSERLRAVGEPSDKAGFLPAAGASWPLVQITSQPSPYFGGGNTLRIGRPEHPRFNQPTGHYPADMPPMHAARLLDLFHAGKSRASDSEKSLREGPVARIEGHVNINTASRDSLRAMAAGILQMDPKLSKRTSDVFDSRMAPSVEPLTTVSALTASKEADTVVDAIILGRPYTSPSELACAMNSDGKQVFGNEFLYPYTPSGQSFTSQLQWADAAAEEIFGRVYEASTVRSRNFRVWVIGQAVSPTTVGNQNPEVLSETRKAFTIFADPGERQNGVIDPSKTRVTILHENDF
jgi:type II secretory pathway pseudopilin PulG